MIIYIVLVEFWIWGNSFFPGCDQPLSSLYIISIFEYIIKHAGDWNKEAISQKARNAALNPPSLHCMDSVWPARREKFFSDLCKKRSIWFSHYVIHNFTITAICHAFFKSRKSRFEEHLQAILIEQSVFQRYLKLV